VTQNAIIPALGMLDSKLDTPAARAMLIAIALQEPDCAPVGKCSKRGIIGGRANLGLRMGYGN